MEYPGIRQFVRQGRKISGAQTCDATERNHYTIRLVLSSKDVAQTIWYARQGKQWALNKLNGLDSEGKNHPYRQQYIKWLPLYESDILISPFCCDKQKEEPIARYEKQTGRHPILALMAEESARRKEAYLRTGCKF